MRFLLFALIVLTQCAWSTGWQQDQSAFNLNVSGHLTTTVTTKPTASACGTNPSVATTSTDMTGNVTVGSGSVTACKVTFNQGYSVKPNCFLMDTGHPWVTALTATTDTAAMYIQSLGAATLQNASINYFCAGGAN